MNATRAAARIAIAIAAVVALCLASAAAEPTLNVGSKRFTESYILGEILAQTAQLAGEASVVHRQGLGNTAIVLGALTQGSIDVYPEYTGTIAKEILKLDAVPPLPELNAQLAAIGLAVAVPLGFNNTRWRCAPTTRAPRESPGCPISSRIRSLSWDCPRSLSDEPTAGRD